MRSLASRSSTKLVHILFSGIGWLINYAASRGARRISQRNERPGRQHDTFSWSARHAQGHPKFRRTVPYYQQISWDNGRSGGIYSPLAWELAWCVFVCMAWDFNWTIGQAKYILAVPQKNRVIELWKKVDGSRNQLDTDLAIEIRVAQQLDDLVQTLGGDRLPLRDPCMPGTRHDILQEIVTGIKNTNGHNVIWIRGAPGVGKSALAASITSRLQGQNRHVIWFGSTVHNLPQSLQKHCGVLLPVILHACIHLFAND